MDEAELDLISASALEAALGLTSWSPCVERIRLALDASVVTLLTGPADGSSFEDLAQTAQGGRTEAARYKTIDPSVPKSVAIAAHRLDLKPVAHIFEMIPERDYRRSEYYADFARQAGMYYRLGFSALRGGPRMAPFGVHRAENATPFDEADRAALLRIKPFIKQALSLQARLALRPNEAAGWGALDAVADPVLAVDDELRIAHANAAAEALDGDPTSPVRLRATLGCCRREDDASLRRLIRAVSLAGRPGCAIRATGPASAAPGMILQVFPLLSRLTTEGRERHVVPGMAMVVIKDLRRGQLPEIATARQLFGLSRSEGEILALLGEGLSAAQIATERAVSEETVRTQIRSLLRKTGAASLRDLARIQALLPRSIDGALRQPGRRLRPQ